MSEKDFTIMHSRNMQQVSVTQRITKVLTLFITMGQIITYTVCLRILLRRNRWNDCRKKSILEKLHGQI